MSCSLTACPYAIFKGVLYEGLLRHPVEERLWQGGHGTTLGADKGTHLYGQLVGLGDRESLQNGSSKGSGERVTCSYRVGHLHLGGLLEADEARGEDVTAVGTTGQNQHLQVILGQQNPALVLQVNTGVAEDTADSNQLFVVNLQDVAAAHGVTEHLLGVEILAQVDVENLQLRTRIGHGVEEAVDGGAAHLAALSQRAEADGTGAERQVAQGVGEGDVVPSHTLLDLILRHANLVERDLYRTRGVIHTVNLRIELLLGKHLENLVAQRVIAHGADYAAVEAKLRDMVCKVGGSTTDFLSFGQAIPQRLTHSYDDFVHDIYVFKFIF